MLTLTMRRCIAAAVLLALCLGFSAPAQSQGAGAQAYPNRVIKLVVPYPAGGSTDILARLVAAKLGEAWGQPAVVENRPGASGIIGNDLVAKAAGDGYTVLMGITALIQGQSLFAKLPYDPIRDFLPVAQLALSADLFVVQPNNPANSLKEFVELAKANPKKYNYGSYGNGTSSHLHGEMLNEQAGLDLTHVAYRGAAPQITDFLGGQLSAAFIDSGSIRQHLSSGKFKVLAVTGERRSKLAPAVPTFTELGYKAFEPYGWFGVFLPAATPAEIVNKLSTEVVRILQLHEVAARIDDLGLQISGKGAQEFAEVVKTDTPLWAKVIKDAKVKLD